MESKGRKPKWKGDGIAVWDWGDGRISVKLVGHDYVTAFLQDNKQRPVPKIQAVEEVLPQ
jgi:hypothetical protein